MGCVSRTRQEQLAATLCLDYARQLLAGLAALHAAGMVHRDVKPANCLFVGGQLKLADFGLLTEDHPLVSRIGTRQYMPPDGRMDTRADVYAAGLVIYEIISGQTADRFPSLGRRSQEIASDRILTSLLHLSLKACEREPEKRFADARQMLAELENGPKSRRPLRRRPAAAIFAAAALSAVIVFVWSMLPQTVDVNFVTLPYEARIFLDGKLLVDANRQPYTTPCTVNSLPSGRHTVAFECNDRPMWDVGEFDFSRTRQVVSKE